MLWIRREFTSGFLVLKMSTFHLVQGDDIDRQRTVEEVAELTRVPPEIHTYQRILF